jgi:hypothetical protein
MRQNKKIIFFDIIKNIIYYFQETNFFINRIKTDPGGLI